nr:hypothetical protein [Thermoclostridium stercorarium]
MNNINLNVQVRNTIGNGSANRLRNSGYIPGIVYGKDMELPLFRSKIPTYSTL